MINRQQATTPDAGSVSGSAASHGAGPNDMLRLGLVVGALGVVFGDPHPVPISTDNVFGVVSLVFWSVTIIVTITYVLLVMRADNDGEGGIMALITLLRRWGADAGRPGLRGAGWPRSRKPPCCGNTRGSSR